MKKDMFDLDLTVTELAVTTEGDTTAYPWGPSVNCSYAPAQDEIGPEVQVC
ncbi:hypothetical protein [Tumebacillus avium]|uniref:hypothetical protein n=1 Tax=Tumebacillus avium TaxID=1903704 RepID=UPI0012FE793B|nr:hypothetical protein [Tumebacillus avium]